jgi:eukaryotic-like serine/threonine-protein kinase
MSTESARLTPLTAHLAPPLPTVLAGRYRIDRQLGAGGMGVVYLAHDLTSDRTCALKLLHRHRVGPHGLYRFKREFRAASRLDHPNCLRAQVLDRWDDGGHHGGGWFFTMDHAAGGPLRPAAWARWQDLVPLVMQVLAALDHLHAKQMVHRDIKPPNILLDAAPTRERPRPRVLLADFGIAKMFDTEDLALGEVLGSLAYLAPEQLEGHADPRSDLYALGLVMYEALAGAHPQAALLDASACTPVDARRWLALRRQALPPLAARLPEVPPALTALVMRLVEPRPEGRPATAADVLDELVAATCDRGMISLPPLRRAAYLAAPRLAGRQDERARLRDFVAAVATGAGQGVPFICFLSGPAGAGKSRLAAQLVEAAGERGARLEMGTWRPEEGGPWPLRGLFQVATLERFAGALTQAATDVPWLPGAHTTTTGPDQQAPPTLPLPSLPGGGDPSADREAHQWAVYRQVADAVLAEASHQPLLFVFEDAHWADIPSLELLGFLLRSVAQARLGPRPPRLGILVTHRPAPGHVALADLLALARDHQAALEIALGPLDVAGATDLVASMLMVPPAPEVAAFTGRIYPHSEGNPLALTQTLHLLLATGRLHRRPGAGWDLADTALAGAELPRSVDQAIGDRAARLGADAKRALAAAAVIGRTFEFTLLEAASDMDAGLLIDCLDEAIRADFLLEHQHRPGVYQFVHEYLRDAIVARLPAADRRALHAATAAALDRRHGASPEVAAELAHHQREAGQRAAACASFARAADFAALTCAFARAADHFDSALALAAEPDAAPDPTLFERHADACLYAGRYDQAAASYARRLATVSAPLARAELLRKCAEVEFRRGHTGRAGEELEQVLDTLGERLPRRRPAVIAGIVGNVGLFAARDRWPRSDAPGDRAGDRAGDRDRLCAWTYLRAAEVFYFNDLARSYYYNIKGLNLAERLGPSRELAVGLAQQAYIMATLGLRRWSSRCLDRARSCAERLGPLDKVWERLMRGMSLGCAGDAHGYAREVRAAEALLADTPEPMRLRQAWTLRSEALMSTGDIEEAERTAHELLRLSGELQDPRSESWGLRLVAQAHGRRGQHGRAIEIYERAIQQGRAGGDTSSALLAEARLAWSLLFHDRIDEALRRAVHAAGAWSRLGLRHPSAVHDGVLLAAAALVLHRNGRLPADAARAVTRTQLLRWPHARAVRLSAPLFLAGSAALAWARHRPARSRRLFSRALAVADGHALAGERSDVEALADLLERRQLRSRTASSASSTVTGA